MRWPLVRVTWIDSASPSPEWHTLSEWRGLGSLECVSVGYLIAEDKLTRTIAPHLAYPGEAENCKACGIMVIPNGVIRSVETLAASPSSRRASSLKRSAGSSSSRRRT